MKKFWMVNRYFFPQIGVFPLPRRLHHIKIRNIILVEQKIGHLIILFFNWQYTKYTSIYDCINHSSIEKFNKNE